MIKPIPLPHAGRTLLLLALLAVVWFGPLDTPRLFEPDEGRYGEIPREMLASGDWVTPRHQVLREASPAVLGDRRRPARVRA